MVLAIDDLGFGNDGSIKGASLNADNRGIRCWNQMLMTAKKLLGSHFG
jgi:hypothetical protein